MPRLTTPRSTDRLCNASFLQRLFVEAALEQIRPRSASTGSPSAGTRPERTRLVLAADSTPLVRAQSPTARDRTYVHVPNLPAGVKPVAPGWQFATVVALPEQPHTQTQPSSWTTILDNRRIPSQKTAAQVVACQLQELSPLLPDDALVVCDGGFGNPGFLSGVHHLPQGNLLHLAKNRTLYRPAPPKTGKTKTGKKGALKKDGAAFSLPDAATQGGSDEEWRGQDEQGHTLAVSLLRVRYPNAPDSKPEPGVLWLLWQGSDMPALSEIVPLYRRRFSIEHGSSMATASISSTCFGAPRDCVPR